MSSARPAEPEHRPVRTALATLAAFGTGTLVALQSRINGELGQRLDDGFTAAVISFGSGLVILSIAMAIWRPGRRGVRTVLDAIRSREIPWWYAVGGLGGAVFVLSQSLVVGLVGVALFTVGIVAGQTISSVLIDRRGLGTMAAKPVTAPRLIGAVLALVAVGLAVSGRIETDVPFWVLLVPVAVGLVVGGQQAVNGQIRGVSGSALTATFGNFLVGTVALLVVLAVHVPLAGLPHTLPSEPWLYVGGLVGCIFIAGQAVIVRFTGILVMVLAILAGQLVTAAVFDIVVPLPGHIISPLTLVGTALTIVAVLVTSVPPPRRVRA